MAVSKGILLPRLAATNTMLSFGPVSALTLWIVCKIGSCIASSFCGPPFISCMNFCESDSQRI